MPRRTDTRSKMIHAAAELFRQRGYHATTFSDVVRDSGAPRGSTYFHFPGGKAELAREAIAMAGDEMEELVDEAARHAGDPASLVRALAQIFASRFERSGYQSGCPIATMVLELAPRDEEFSADFDSVFARWRAALVTRFEPLGTAPDHAAALADLTISALEGALVLSRAARSTEPFKTPIEALISAIDHHAAPPPSPPIPEAGPGAQPGPRRHNPSPKSPATGQEQSATTLPKTSGNHAGIRLPCTWTRERASPGRSRTDRAAQTDRPGRHADL